ncbi:MAG TPA: hypothetical protein VMA37_01475 [Acetobacteraceae bacterium]|nr:hypothetical protein [Acetobacteraceae bacterium]
MIAPEGEPSARPEWLQRILADAEPVDAVELIRRLDQLERAGWAPWQARADRLRWRDLWVRVALAAIDAPNRPAPLAAALRRRAAARTPAPFGTSEGLLQRILDLSDGRTLSRRQIAAIVACDRSSGGR